MNRRSFFGRVAAAAAVPALLGSTEAGAKPAEKPAPSTEGSSTPTPDVAATSSVVPTRLALLASRGLLVPCPNCGVTKWKDVPERKLLRCDGCDWLDHDHMLVQRCPCRQCGGASNDRMPAAERRAIDRDAPVGVYAVLENGVLVTRVELNDYDVCRDRMIHHVKKEMRARVDCAVWLQNHGDPGAPHDATEKYYQPNGNRVCIGWSIVDCLEWQQERARGERP